MTRDDAPSQIHLEARSDDKINKKFDWNIKSNYSLARLPSIIEGGDRSDNFIKHYQVLEMNH